MLLTGKCKEDFLIHLKKTRRCNEKSFSEFPAIFEDALIVEWLDSVNMKILPCHGLSGWYCELKNYNNKEFGNYKCFLVVKKQINDFNTRSEATQKAILKANKIYNNLNTKENEK